jgi:hypothetical protein
MREMRNPSITLANLFLCTVMASACEMRVTEVPKAESKTEAKGCVLTNASVDDLANTIDHAIKGKDYGCVGDSFINAKSKAPDARIVEAGRRALQAGDLPDSVIVAMLSYLTYATNGQVPELLQQNLEAVKRTALGGSEATRPIAIALLSMRRSDDDLDVFVSGVDSGDDAVLAYSLFALADNCSSRAKGLLKHALQSTSVQRYLKKYADKESVTSTIRGACPGVLG